MVVDVGRQQRFVRIIGNLLPADQARPTGRELAVGYLAIAEGLPHRAVAARLEISVGSVERNLRVLAETLCLAGPGAMRRAVTRALWD